MKSLKPAQSLKFLSFAFLVLFAGACSLTGESTPEGPLVASTTDLPAPLTTVLPHSPTPTVNRTQAPTQPAETAAQLPLASPSPTVPAQVKPQSFPAPEGYFWQVLIEGLEAPVGVLNAGDGSGRLFILEQPGRVRLYFNGSLLPHPFLDIRDRVGSRGSEQGLLGLAFHPQFIHNGLFYVNYTDKRGDTVISRFQVSEDDPMQADPDSEYVLLQASQPYGNHNGGAMAFGPDGYLYLGLGDGGSGGDPLGNGQSLQTFLGKILRLDVDSAEPYAIPTGNPFASGGGLPEIWAYGLRNPWRFSFDRLTGDLYIGDVGQNQWEEIDFLPAQSAGGANFGWNFLEGNHPFQGTPPSDLALIPPVAEYDHSQGCSVTGGVVYRGARLPEFQGIYLFGDFCSGAIWGLFRHPAQGWQMRLLFENVARIASFGEDESGEVVLADYTGRILKLVEK